MSLQLMNAKDSAQRQNNIQVLANSPLQILNAFMLSDFSKHLTTYLREAVGFGDWPLAEKVLILLNRV